MEKIKYACKNCGWETSIREEWGDLRPKRCMNKKCNTSFQKSPDSLLITRPEKPVDQVVLLDESKDENKNGNKNSKRK